MQSTASHTFKTIYFPRERTRTSRASRISISVPAQPDPDRGMTGEFLNYLQSLSSRRLRLALGDPFLEDLEKDAAIEGRSVSNACLRKLLDYFGEAKSPQRAQLDLFVRDAADDVVDSRDVKGDLGLTFRESRHQAVHGWYPYVEGFSATYVRDALLRFGVTPRTVYDPFGGAGTTQLTASLLGIPSFYSEINPFMVFVSETKVRCSAWARRHMARFREHADRFLEQLGAPAFRQQAAAIDLTRYDTAFPSRDFFVDRDIRDLIAARDTAAATEDQEAAALLLLACAANAVHASNMTRRADLRRRKPDEYKDRVVNVPRMIADTVQRMISDVAALPMESAEMTLVSEDARAIPAQYAHAFEFAITSPPYLNGTNYFRNTKIELWLLGFITSETELAGLCQRGVCAGINNVSRNRALKHSFPFLAPVIAALRDTSGDKRIPLMIEHYFSDMFDVLQGVFRSLTPGGRFLLDIGDSRFYGVHVRTDEFLRQCALEAGFTVEQRNFLARRIAHDKNELVQVEFVFQKPRALQQAGPTGDRTASIARFKTELPYKQPPFASRNWGHTLHSLCSYQGKFKPAIAHWLVATFTRKSDRVLDPLGGVGTLPLEAALQGRVAVSNDKSPFAAIVASAKVAPPAAPDAYRALEDVVQRMNTVMLTERDYADAEFGLNGRVIDYYHPDTLSEVLRARRVFLDHRKPGAAETFVWASLLHVLHGNRPYALSRTSHPITPFRPAGPFQYRSLQQKVADRLTLAFREPLPQEFTPGMAHLGDFRELPLRHAERFDAIITSPPFLGMRFDRPNWLRLWFCGWNADSFHKTSLTFLERQQTKSMTCYSEFFHVAADLLAPSGVLVVHLGSGGKRDMVGELRTLAQPYFRVADEITENVQAVEQHGIRDKGLTTTHHFLVFEPQ